MSTLTLFYQDVQKISGYTVVEEIHAKATTRIYKVRANTDYFALKIVDQSSKPQRIKRFQRELQFLQMFADASGIPRVYKYGNIHNNPYYVMEYVEGPSLTTHVNARQRLSEQEALKIIKNLCVVVKQIHEKQVFHCNLSPANILLSQEQAFVLGLGGCVRSVELTQNVEATGSLHYLSPEHVNGNHDKLGPWSDAYSLGAVLYFLLTGNAPFDAPSEVEVIHNLAMCNLRSITDYDIQISQKCQSIVERALLQDIHHRYQNIDELLVDVMCCVDLQGASNVTIVQDNFENSSIFSREPTHLPPQGIIPNFEPMVLAEEVPATTDLPSTEGPTAEIKPFLPATKKSENIADKKPRKRPRTKTTRYAKMQGDRPRYRKNNSSNNNRSKNYMYSLLSFSVGIVISFIFIYPLLSGNSPQKQSVEKPHVEKTATVTTHKDSKPQIKNVLPQKPKLQEDNNYQALSKVSSMHQAKWHLQNGIWVGTAQQPFGLMTIADFPHWKNYEFKADVLIKEGQLGIFVRNFIQTAQFPNFLGQMRIFPHKDRWFSVTAVANGNQLLIKIDNTDRRLTRFSIPSANPGIVGFGLAPEKASKPALAYVKNIRMKKLP